MIYSIDKYYDDDVVTSFYGCKKLIDEIRHTFDICKSMYIFVVDEKASMQDWYNHLELIIGIDIWRKGFNVNWSVLYNDIDLSLFKYIITLIGQLKQHGYILEE